MRTPLLLALTLACAPPTTSDGDTGDIDLTAGAPGDPGAVTNAAGDVIFAAIADAPAWRGPGGPAVTFDSMDLFENCAYLPGGPGDIDHHNLVMPYRGHLVMPWSPEIGTGGVSLFDVSDPCNPKKVGEGTSSDANSPFGTIRETHAFGFVMLPDDDPNAGEWMFTNMIESPLVGNTGIQTWDMTDLEEPVPVAGTTVSGAIYPDSYNLVTLSLFVQYPYVYTASANAGIHVVDISDPLDPTEVGAFTFPQGFRTGGVFAMGTRLFVSSAEETQAAVLDISDPTDPQLIPGGLWTTKDRDGNAREAYHANIAGHYALFARKDGAGGPIVYDISDPTNPTFVGDNPTLGSGGYIFYDEGYLFTGDSNLGHITDASDMANLETLGEAHLPGDLDTLTPFGNVAIVAVDDPGDDPTPGQSTAVMPWSLEPDVASPKILGHVPMAGDTGVATTARIGIGFNEPIEPSSAFAGSIRVWDADDHPVPGWVSAQETIASFAPKQALEPGTTYTVEVVADGITDINGNAFETTETFTFTTEE